MAQKDNPKTLLLIDCYALIYRAYYAFPSTLTDAEGNPINAVYGFASLLIDVLLKFKPSHVVALMDSQGPTFRHIDYTQYKANRSEADNDFVIQLPRVEHFLKTFKIPMLQVEGYEADDIIATIDSKYSGKWARTIIVTGDRDLFQLVDEDTFVYLAASSFSQSKLFDESMVVEKMGVKPLEIPDYKGLMGDPSDNIPGVKGIGPKSAVDLISEFGSVENIYENIDKVGSKYQKKLIENQELAFISKKLATVFRDVPVSFDFNDCKFENLPISELKTLFEELRFRSVMGRLETLSKEYLKVEDVSEGSNLDLFEQVMDISSVKIPDAWNGKKIEGEDIYALFDIDSTEDSLRYKLKKGYFIVDSYENNKVLSFESDQLKDFAKLIETKNLAIYDLKNVSHVTLNHGIEMKYKTVRDLGVEATIIGSGKITYNLKNIIVGFGKTYSDNIFDNLALLKDLSVELLDKLANNSKFKDLVKLEQIIIPLVMQMERCGINIDATKIGIYHEILQTTLDKLKRLIFENVGHEFNLNSPKQMGDVLFKEKQLPVNRKTKGGSFSTDEATLMKLQGIDPVIDFILKYRELDKILSTYIKALPGFINPTTHKIHAIFDQLGAVSGRFSSRNPNMQNLPKESIEGVNIRSLFLSESNSLLISFDYSQQELRILAALSNEKSMVGSFNNGQDIHKLTASEIFNVPIEEVNAHQRGIGKTINFSVIYGISPFALSERLKIPRQEATSFIDKYFEKYSNVRAFMDKVLIEARENGYVETVLGRRRINEMIYSNNKNLRGGAERELFNLVIQGSAADIMKIAMSRMQPILDKYPAHLLSQIHDEFLFEYKTENINNPEKDEKFLTFIKEIYNNMITAYDIGVNYQVEHSVGTNWGDMKSLNI